MVRPALTGHAAWQGGTWAVNLTPTPALGLGPLRRRLRFSGELPRGQTAPHRPRSSPGAGWLGGQPPCNHERSLSRFDGIVREDRWMKLPAEYWITIGTILPVLALALVVEARSFASSWTPDSSRLVRVLRVVQTILWVSPLIAATFSEAEALSALRGATVEPWAWRLCYATVLASFAVLVVSPAIDLAVRAWPGPLSRIVASHPILRVKSFRIGRSIEHGRRDRSRARTELDSKRALALSMLEGIEKQLDDAEATGMPREEVHHYRTQLKSQRSWTRRQFAEQDTKWDAVEARAGEVGELYVQIRESLERQLAVQQSEVTELLIRGGLGPGGAQNPTATPPQKPGECPRSTDD